MSDNSNNDHFSGVRIICRPYLAITLASTLLGPRMQLLTANEAYSLKMNIIVNVVKPGPDYRISTI